MKKRKKYLINVSKMPQSGSDFEFFLEPEWLEKQLEDCHDVTPPEGGHVKVNVSPVGGNYYVKGKVELKLKMTCVRCLREAEIPVQASLSVVMVKEGSNQILAKSRKMDLGVARYSGDEIMLDDEIREAILVELPMNPRCPEECSVEDLYK
ncbi:MAG: DUF177 domain-containing protein [Pseudomonadota bacterium]